MTNLTLIALGLHVLGDYHLQWPGLAKDKLENRRAFVLHALIYSALFALPALLDHRVLPAMAAIAASHLIIDLIKGIIPAPVRQRHEMPLYLADQTLHLLTLVLCCEYFFRTSSPPVFAACNQNLIKWALLALLITKPANITLKLALSKYAPDPQTEAGKNREISGAGALIGSLERILTAILLGLGQFAAIGLVFTAKSLARFDRISKDQSFAEYYLIGSLSSLLWAFLCWLLLFHALK
ncbi:MAG: DUF3307 domain-containing protein [Clostridiales bacterium]|nr:DUF3307 domain-containing protein [Clostridiales bacterium]